MKLGILENLAITNKGNIRREIKGMYLNMRRNDRSLQLKGNSNLSYKNGEAFRKEGKM